VHPAAISRSQESLVYALGHRLAERIVRSLPTLPSEQVPRALDYWREPSAEIDGEIRADEEALALIPSLVT
jgi:hypothetical protein